MASAVHRLEKTTFPFTRAFKLWCFRRFLYPFTAMSTFLGSSRNLAFTKRTFYCFRHSIIFPAQRHSIEPSPTSHVSTLFGILPCQSEHFKPSLKLWLAGMPSLSLYLSKPRSPANPNQIDHVFTYARMGSRVLFFILFTDPGTRTDTRKNCEICMRVPGLRLTNFYPVCSPAVHLPIKKNTGVFAPVNGFQTMH